MKKFFVAFCFMFLLIADAGAKITSINEYIGSLQRSPKNQPPKTHIISQDEFSDFAEFMKERLEKAPKLSLDTYKSTTIARGKTPYELQKEKENNKSIFEKIYDRAMQKATQATAPVRRDVIKPYPDIKSVAQQQKQWNNPDIPTVVVPLPPHNKPTRVVAREHIPYLATTIELLNNGLTKINDTVTVLANGDKLKTGLTKILPMFVYNGDKKQVLDYSIISVTRNGEEVGYHLIADDRQIMMVPDDETSLPAGVYTYNFEYLVDNLLIEHDDRYLMYWNVGGGRWNLVVDRLGATILLPQKDALWNYHVFFGTDNNLYPANAKVVKNGLLGTSYIANRPLFIGEGMYIFNEIDKNAVYPFGWWQRFLHIFYNYGDVILSAFGMFFIALSLGWAWHYIKIQKKLQKITLPKTALFMRALMYNKFDLKSVGGFILEMYKKNVIDIQQAESTILLIKRTDNLQNLSANEQAALKQLFPAHETIFNANPNNKLVFSRFVGKLKKGLQNQLRRFYLKVTGGYALINLMMLLIIEAAIAYFKISSLYTFGVLAVCTIINLAVMLLWNFAQSRWGKIGVRMFIIDICLAGGTIMSTVTSPESAALLVITQGLIVTALNCYVSKFGLIKYYINNIAQYRDTIVKNSENIILGKNFATYQAAIWALDLSDDIVPIKKEEYYKIPTIKALVDIMSR